MNKRQGLIVLSCVASVAIIGLIAIGAYKIFGSSDCELIDSSQPEMINQGNKTFHSLSAIHSSDSTLLIKISAHLEYHNIHDSHNNHNNNNNNNNNNITASAGPRAQALVAQPATSPVNELQQPAPIAAGSAVTVAGNGIGATSGSVGAGAGVAGQQQHLVPAVNPMNQPVAAAITVIPHHNDYSSNDNRRSQGKRFLPLELDRVQSQGSMYSMGRQNYTLHFNCTKMRFTFVRKADIVQIEQVTLDTKRVKVDGDSKQQKQATECHLILANQQGEHQKWSAEYNPKNGLAVYSCQKPELMRYKCFHNSEHLLSVQFEAIQFMISKNASQVSSKFDSSPTHQCS